MPDRRSSEKPPRLLLTCEHAGNRVPAGLEDLIPRSVLETHRAYDPGTLALTHFLAGKLGAPSHVHLLTRLVIDTNRSLENREAFSSYTASLADGERERLVRLYYRPFRDAVMRDARLLLKRAGGRRASPRLVHVSVHSFTPVLRGVRRAVDVGILFDPGRAPEAELAERWIRELRRLEPRLRIKANEPYEGTSDGHTTALRKEFAPADYAGIEIELNQRFVRDALAGRAGGRRLARIHQSIAGALAAALVGKPQKPAKKRHLSTKRQKSREKRTPRVADGRKRQ